MSDGVKLNFINPPAIAAPTGYTHVVEVVSGRMVYISGQVPLDSAGNLVGLGDLEAQTRQVFENLKAALAAVGGDFNNVVKFTYFLLDASQLQMVRTVRNEYINTANPPASSLIEVRRLFRDDILIEIEVVAALPA